jgi:hypothetical protein
MHCVIIVKREVVVGKHNTTVTSGMYRKGQMVQFQHSRPGFPTNESYINNTMPCRVEGLPPRNYRSRGRASIFRLLGLCQAN